MLQVAMLSKWHVHADMYADSLKKLDNVKITAVWDEDALRGKKWASELNADFEKDLDTLLKRQDVDCVVVCAPTSMHKEVIVAAAQAGKHIFTEKAMALTKKECEIISKAVKDSGVKFCISFPYRTNGTYIYAKNVIDSGLIGNITLLRVGNGHDGALNNWLPDYWYDEKTAGGGAMMDLGCHPMYITSWILGKPKRISSIFNYYTGKAVEDNAVCSIEFENKAIAIVESSLVSVRKMNIFEAYGTLGSLIISGSRVKLTSKKMDPDFDGWLSPLKLPESLPLPIYQWIDAIENDKPVLYGTEDGTKLTELLEGAYISHRENKVFEYQSWS